MEEGANHTQREDGHPWDGHLLKLGDTSHQEMLGKHQKLWGNGAWLFPAAVWENVVLLRLCSDFKPPELHYFPSFRQSIFGTSLKQRAVGTQYFPLLFSTSFIPCGPLFLKHATPSPQDPLLSVLRKLFSLSYFKTNRELASSWNCHTNPTGRLNFSSLWIILLQTLSSITVSGCCR